MMDELVVPEIRDERSSVDTDHREQNLAGGNSESQPKRSGRWPGAPLACGAVTGIGVIHEGPLHAAVKAVLARPGDRVEVPLDGFVIDLVRADGELVEVQTGGFTALGRKLDSLLDQHRFRVVHPIAAERRVVRVGPDAEIRSLRRSPRRGTPLDVFDRLVAFPSLLTHPNLTIEIFLVREDHVRGLRPVASGRRTRDPGERRLVEVLDQIELRTVSDIHGLLPALPQEPFTTRELGSTLDCTVLLAQRIAYCLRALNILEPAGKRGRAPLHRLGSHRREHN
jgi:hypothetical protein